MHVMFFATFLVMIYSLCKVHFGVLTQNSYLCSPVINYLIINAAFAVLASSAGNPVLVDIDIM